MCRSTVASTIRCRVSAWLQRPLLELVFPRHNSVNILFTDLQANLDLASSRIQQYKPVHSNQEVRPCRPRSIAIAAGQRRAGRPRRLRHHLEDRRGRDGRPLRASSTTRSLPRALAGAAPPAHPRGRVLLRARGTLGALLGDEVVTAGPGTWVLKPRDQWHTFWNAGDTPCEIIEIISPAGFENFFRELAEVFAGGGPDLAPLGELCGRYGVEMDPAACRACASASGSRTRSRDRCARSGPGPERRSRTGVLIRARGSARS